MPVTQGEAHLIACGLARACRDGLGRRPGRTSARRRAGGRVIAISQLHRTGQQAAQQCVPKVELTLHHISVCAGGARSPSTLGHPAAHASRAHRLSGVLLPKHPCDACIAPSRTTRSPHAAHPEMGLRPYKPAERTRIPKRGAADRSAHSRARPGRLAEPRLRGALCGRLPAFAGP